MALGGVVSKGADEGTEERITGIDCIVLASLRAKIGTICKQI